MEQGSKSVDPSKGIIQRAEFPCINR